MKPEKNNTSTTAGQNGRFVSVQTVALALLPVIAGAIVFVTFFARPNSPTQEPSTVVRSLSQAENGERAAYKIDGDFVYVNNTICANTGSPLDTKTMGKFQSQVTYDGPLDKFHGKTLIFNQCCAMCAGAFPQKWAAERDEIMRFHGLAN